MYICIYTHTCKQIGFPVMIISVAVSNVYLMILNAAFWQATAGQ